MNIKDEIRSKALKQLIENHSEEYQELCDDGLLEIEKYGGIIQ